VGATLAVALITSAIAAVVTRRVTRPIVHLTETAARMARGDLDQRVTIARRDEIGILARAFNRMAAELGILYGDLEAKVVERTRQLEEANNQTNYHLMQLATSAEVARVATSIRDLDTLLADVVGLIGRAFELHHASIYISDQNGQWAMVAESPAQADGTEVQPCSGWEVGGDPDLVACVAADGQRRVVRAGNPLEGQAGAGTVAMLRPPVACEMAVPLRIQERILGVLDLKSTRSDDFGENEEVVYQSLADQISIAIENARAYAIERETVERLRDLDRIQSQFLTNMSHALRTPLNSIIGFSRVLLKELDGPLNEMQRADLEAIYESGRQLLGLISDMLELSRLDLGMAPFLPGRVDLAEIIEGVMATARALARGKPVQLYDEVPTDLPILYTDGQRVRQVVLALLSNAVKFTDEGSVHLRVTADDGQVTISVEDAGMVISREQQDLIFADMRYGETGGDEDVPSFGLAISKRVVEKLGGRIWVESVEGVGSTFTFSLPVRPLETEMR
jgi:signal transduction histidine kinase